MRWRDIIIGSISTLIVSIIGGTILYYITREPHIEDKEDLVYTIDSAVSFNFENNKIAVSSITFTNKGTKVANNISGEIVFPVGKIKDKKITSSTGANSELVSKNRKPNEYYFSLVRFLPNDKITMSFLLDDPDARPNISIRSNESVATKYAPTQPDELRERIYKYYWLLNIAVAVFATLIALFGIIIVKKILSGPSYFKNTAFVMLHKGLISEANRSLKLEVEKGKSSCYALANYALTQCFLGKDKSNRLFAAAVFLAKTDKEKALIEFNQSIVSMKQSRWKDATTHLSKALELSSKAIKHYCRDSIIFLELAAENSEMVEFFNSKKINKKKPLVFVPSKTHEAVLSVVTEDGHKINKQ